MRIFCGLTGDATTIAAAVVNERGGVIATSEVTDDAFGYLDLCRMWVRHAEIAHVAVADHSDTRALLRLAASAGQPTAQAPAIELNTDDPLDIAVHIARMFARGELSTRSGPPGEPDEVCQLVGGLHTLTTNAHAGHASLIELLRQAHPAALAAWGDPTETAALEVLRTSLSSEPAAAVQRTKPDPGRVKELALALERTQRARGYQLEPRVAAGVAATAESVLSSERACLGFAAAVDDQLALPSDASTPRRLTTDYPTAARNRRTAGDRSSAEHPVVANNPADTSGSEPVGANHSANDQPSAEQPVPQPRRTKQPPSSASAPPAPSIPDPDDEPVTAPLRLPGTSSGSEGFPLMPEPPQFVEPESLPSEQPASSADDDLLSTPVNHLPPGFDEADDDDLLIFSQARSAWFKGPAAIEDSDEAWNFPADEGWRAAEAASDNRKQATETTSSGLPRRVPQANLVPGSAILSDTPPVPINRDATALASRTAGFFRGWSRARRETVSAGAGS